MILKYRVHNNYNEGCNTVHILRCVLFRIAGAFKKFIVAYLFLRIVIILDRVLILSYFQQCQKTYNNNGFKFCLVLSGVARNVGKRSDNLPSSPACQFLFLITFLKFF